MFDAAASLRRGALFLFHGCTYVCSTTIIAPVNARAHEGVQHIAPLPLTFLALLSCLSFSSFDHPLRTIIGTQNSSISQCPLVCLTSSDPQFFHLFTFLLHTPSHLLSVLLASLRSLPSPRSSAYTFTHKTEERDG